MMLCMFMDMGGEVFPVNVHSVLSSAHPNIPIIP